MTPPLNAGLHNSWRTCKRARSPIPGVSPCPLSDPPPSPPTTPPSWGREGKPARNTAQVLLLTGNRRPQCWTALEKRGTVPLLRCMSCHQAALRTWAPSATPRKRAPDTVFCHHSQGGCQHQQMLYLQHAQDDRAPSPLPSHWQGGETVVTAAAL